MKCYLKQQRRKQEKKSKEDQKRKKTAKRVEINETSSEKPKSPNESLAKLLSEGSKPDISLVKSKEKFSEALEIINRDFNMKTSNEVVLIKYLFAR